MKEYVKEKILSVCAQENTLFDEPLCRHTSFRIGGPADAFVMPANEEELDGIIRICDEEGVPRTIIGNGTNILADDEGYRGVVIQIYKNFSDIRISGEEITAGAGVLLSSLSSACTQESLTGMEFASGIPGTVGGAVFMNAGAYGGEIKDVIVSAKVFEPGKGIKEIGNAGLQLGYRSSIIKDCDMVVLSARFKLQKGDKEAILARVNDLKEQRTSKQPLESPSAGSTFKRPEGYFAGKLIMDAGLKGYSIGGAQVSEKHCGFVINTGNATSKDVKDLMDFIVKTVQDKYGVTLEKEVRFL